MAHNQMFPLKNQVAGHAGFFSLRNESKLCLKPFNTNCVRGLREHLFYQLIEHFKRNSGAESQNFDSEPKPLYYKHFSLLTLPDPVTKCNCIIDEALFQLLSPYIANFYHVRHLIDSSGQFETRPLTDEQLFNPGEPKQSTCPCYGRDPIQKSLCSREFKKVDFLCLEDLTAHCHQPCIIDIKIGQITYDPMAIKEKVLEQSSKYRQLREFGFRILGMKLGEEIKGKTFGKALETTDQVYEALDSFFTPLASSQFKCAVIGKILDRLKNLLDLLGEKNIDQLKFFSSSLLVVYDSHILDGSRSMSVISNELATSVRVSMIDFAHVFHVHCSTSGERPDNGKDLNYLFGLRKLEQFFIKLNRHYQSLRQPILHPPPG